MSEVKTTDYVNDMNSSPGPIPIWGFCLMLMIPVIYLGLRLQLQINSIVSIAVIQCLVSLLGGLWLFKLGKEGLVPIWKADIARRMFLLPLAFFFLELIIVMAMIVWQKIHEIL